MSTQTDTAILPHVPLAHLAKDGHGHALLDHLIAVGDLAARFSADLGFSLTDWARLAGRWHDLGKYAGNFQTMIRETNGFACHIEPEEATGPRDHSTAGATHALHRFGAAGAPLALVIAGHHAGLGNAPEVCRRKAPGTAYADERYTAALRGGAPEEILGGACPPMPMALAGSSPGQARRREVWIRMLFSALCDADFLDTERFLSGWKAPLRGHTFSMGVLGGRLADHLDGIERRASPSPVNEVRREVREACLAAADLPPGVFSLTVPTGGGKTLASLAFALAHAARYDLCRVIVAIPFTSIIEQTAGAYLAALGEEAVLEHHSAVEPGRGREGVRSRLASENWDRPVVVTTTVQLFESLFANRTSRCRKVHRIAKSVIVLDEAQTLPPELLAPILDMLKTLVQDYGVSVVICTATQPALGQAQGLTEGFAQVTEIIPPGVDLFTRLRRVDVRWPVRWTPTSYPALAREIARERDVLAIVHRRKDARDLCLLVDEVVAARGEAQWTAHLSALMCPAHRGDVLGRILARKALAEPVRLVATQLVEAGVDIDFATVYRALGGADAMAQAAGRCNREGKLVGALGSFRVFVAPTLPPNGVPLAAQQATQLLLQAGPLDLFDPETYQRYFRALYGAHNLDGREIQRDRAGLRFKDVAARFKLIDDYTAPVVVPYGEAFDRVAELEAEGLTRGALRRLQRFMVSVPRRVRDLWVIKGRVRVIEETVHVLDDAAGYGDRFGLDLGA